MTHFNRSSRSAGMLSYEEPMLQARDRLAVTSHSLATELRPCDRHSAFAAGAVRLVVLC